MKKNYIAPVAKTVMVKTQALLGTNSTGMLRGEASADAKGLSRENRGSSWDDEE